MTSPEEHHLVRVRLEKLDRLRERGIDPYPHTFRRSHTITEAVNRFLAVEDDLEDGRTEETFVLAGRIMAVRDMGRVSFMDLRDQDAGIQAMFRSNILNEEFAVLEDLDIGDWIGVGGPMLRTRTGEVTLEVRTFEVLSKSVRPLPEKWHGLRDVEIRYRQRYLDLISNEDARRLAVMRSRVSTEMRRFMDGRGFMEVETPILVSVAAGAMAQPFITHHNDLGRDFYLRIATELYLKRLIVGGLEKVYEIGRVFRNEGSDFYHNPEYTMLESYEAYADYTDVMAMTEEMVHHIALEVCGSSSVEYDGRAIDFTPPWPRLELRAEIAERTGIDFLEHPELEDLRAAMANAGYNPGEQVSWGGMLDKLISDAVEPHLLEPCFLVDYPVEMSPLAKRHRDKPGLVERFEGFAAGMEICNSFTELNDPVDQRQRFERQEALRLAFQEEDLDRLDEDFLVAVEHGMPPTGGLGIGVDRLTMLLSGEKTIREVILFPHMRER